MRGAPLLFVLRCFAFISGASVTLWPDDSAIRDLWRVDADTEVEAGERARYSDVDGTALNAAARAVLRKQGSARRQHAMGGGGDAAGNRQDGALSEIPAVDIHGLGRYKFVLIEASNGSSKRQLVRSKEGIEFHADVFSRALQHELEPRGVSGLVLGGGRLVHNPQRKRLEVYGYSKTFGRCAWCNERVAAMLRKQYPAYAVTWSNEGY